MERIRRLVGAGKLLLALGVAGGAFGIATAVQASIPDASGVIHGCYFNLPNGAIRQGSLRAIDTAAGPQCRSDETAVNWNQKGVTGAAGPTGPKGPTGSAGPSDITTNYGGTATNIAKGAGATVASVALPAGKYMLMATTRIIGSALSQASCSFSSSGGTSSGLHTSANEILFEDEVYETMPIVGEITITAGPTTLNLICQAQGGGINVLAALIAMHIGTINDQ
jgi:hypothetical protein